MSFRVSDNMNLSQVQDAINKNRGDMASYANQAATNKRMIKPSDDPVAAARVLQAKSDLNKLGQYEKNNNSAKSFLQFTDQALEDLTEVYMRAKELVLAQSNAAGASRQSRKVVATEVQQLYEQALAVANSKFGERYVFGGFQTLDKPFSASGEYLGDKGDIMLETNKGNFTPINIPGSRVFLGQGLRQEPTYTLDSLAKEKRDVNIVPQKGPEVRGPAGIGSTPGQVMQEGDATEGINILKTIYDFKIALMADDVSGINDAIDDIDTSLEQIITSRAQVGSRLSTLETTINALSKQKVDAKILISEFEDADAFEVYSELKRAENNLQATLKTSGQLLSTSLLDFIR